MLGDPKGSVRARWPCTTSLGASAVDQEGEGISSANSSGVLVWCSTCRRSLLKHLDGIEAYLQEASVPCMRIRRS